MCLLESFAKNAECHPHLNEPVVARIIDQIKVAYWNAGRALTLGTTPGVANRFTANGPSATAIRGIFNPSYNPS